jgi:hypothetical protein
VYRVSSLELKRPELDVDQFAPTSAHFKLVDLHLYSQYTPLFLGQKQLHIFTLPVSSKFTFDQRTYSGLVWFGLIEIVGCSSKQRTTWRANRYAVEKFMKKPQQIPLLSRNLATLFTRINNLLFVLRQMNLLPKLVSLISLPSCDSLIHSSFYQFVFSN